MNELIEKVKLMFKENNALAYGIMAVLAILVCVWVLSPSPTSKIPPPEVEETAKDEMGLSVSDSQRLNMIKSLQERYADFEDRIKDMEKSVTSIKKSNESLRKRQEVLQDQVKAFRLRQARSKAKQEKAANLELAVANIKKESVNQEDIYLPLGSFCKGTLITGVYASTDNNNPLPVLISLDEAFYGPNKIRIPLAGSFALGKAVGDLNSSRALIQVVAMSSVLPNGQVFEYTQDMGYITDQQGQLGIGGRIVRNTGKALALSFLGGFTSGGAGALASQEVTTSQGSYGVVERNVTGDVGKHAMFSGLSRSASDLAKFYEKDAENIVPAVFVPSGQEVYFIVQQGVRIHGFKDRNMLRLSPAS